MVMPQTLPESGPLKKYAEAINRLTQAVKGMQLNPGLGYTVRRSSHGQVLSIQKSAKNEQESGAEVSEFFVLGHNRDFIECHKASAGSPINTTDVYYVAKPWHLRVTTQLGQGTGMLAPHLGFDFIVQMPLADVDFGATRILWDRTGGLAYQKVQEVLDPPYLYGDIILCAQLEDAVSGLDPQGNAVTWVDLNAGGRHYRTKYQKQAVCIVDSAGVTRTKTIYLPASTPF